jgi:NAD kinase
MKRLTDNKIILIKRKTRLENLIGRYNTIQQAQFYIEHMGADFSDYLAEDENYKSVIEQALETLESLGRVQVVDREFLPNFIFGKDDTIVAVGQDGLVANTLKYLTTQPLVGVNPDPERWDGVLLPFEVTDLPLLLPEVFQRKRRIREVTLAKAELNDGQSLYGVNDLFIGQRTHVSARYQIELEGFSEQQSSSGIIVSTGLGSTGWFKSILAGASSIARQSRQGEAFIPRSERFEWNSPFLYYTVREPYPSKATSANLVFGQIKKNECLKIVSQMPESGVIFSDGVESDYLQFNSGIEASIRVAEKKGHLVT